MKLHSWQRFENDVTQVCFANASYKHSAKIIIRLVALEKLNVHNTSRRLHVIALRRASTITTTCNRLIPWPYVNLSIQTASNVPESCAHYLTLWINRRILDKCVRTSVTRTCYTETQKAFHACMFAIRSVWLRLPRNTGRRIVWVLQSCWTCECSGASGWGARKCEKCFR